MSEKEIIEFFDSWADVWDEHMVIDDDIVKTILDAGRVEKDKKVLDVACGTGVLIPYYLERSIDSVLGIDISPRMIEIAVGKFDQENVAFVCGNALTYAYPDHYDCIVIYNAFPHFEDAQKLIDHLSGYLKEGGTLTVAHGMSRERINMHHDNVQDVSNLLPDLDEMKKMFEKKLDVTEMISDERMYLVTGRKR